MKKQKEDQIILKEEAEKLLELMLLEATIEVEEDADNEAILLKIDAPKEAGLIIGSRGKTLNSLQIIFGMILGKKTGNWRRVIVDTSGWRDKENERLTSLAEITAKRAKETGEPQYLYNLTPSQRRLIHISLVKDTKVKTESQGEGEDRCLVIASVK